MLFLLLSAILTLSPPDPDTAPPAETEDADAYREVLSWIERARAGDEDAFASLVSHYEKFVFHTACRVLTASGSSEDAAEDAAQEAFIKAWRSLGSFRGECAFSTWLFRITVNTARDMLRSAARRPTVSLSHETDDDEGIAEWDVPVTSGDTVPEDAVEKKELILSVRRAVESLPQEQRQVVVMRDLHGLSYGEISERLGVEMGTVKSRLNRGRANLKIILKNGNFF